MTIRLGIIGAGGIGELHAEHVEQAGMRLAAVCDMDKKRADKLAAKYDDAAVFTAVDGLLKTDVDAVLVALPNHLHREVAVAALRAGKDVFLEKPMAMNTAECDAVLEVVKTTGRILQMGFVCRWFAPSVAAKRFIDEGRLGQIYHAKAAFRRRRGIPGLGGWFTTKAKSGGGPLIDLGVHVLDLAWYLSGMPKPVRASAACYSEFGSPMELYTYTDMWAGPPRLEGTFDVEDAAVGLIRFENNLTIELNAIWAANIPPDTLKDGIILLGDKGGCYVNHMTGELRLVMEECEHVVDITPELPETTPWVAQLMHFAECVATRTPADPSPEHGRTVQSILDALYRSSEAKREVEVA
ncbi:MAG: Gfo/Idh/MocA family oxidoreductase [Phycisphaerales bacterium]|nr:Gfo/Idh/MocA family oxidoreductase [Phycisphaerales bacterium]